MRHVGRANAPPHPPKEKILNARKSAESASFEAARGHAGAAALAGWAGHGGPVTRGVAGAVASGHNSHAERRRRGRLRSRGVCIASTDFPLSLRSRLLAAGEQRWSRCTHAFLVWRHVILVRTRAGCDGRQSRSAKRRRCGACRSTRCGGRRPTAAKCAMVAFIAIVVSRRQPHMLWLLSASCVR